MPCSRSAAPTRRSPTPNRFAGAVRPSGCSTLRRRRRDGARALRFRIGPGRARSSTLGPVLQQSGGYVNLWPRSTTTAGRTAYGPAKYDRLHASRPNTPDNVFTQRQHQAVFCLVALAELAAPGRGMEWSRVATSLPRRLRLRRNDARFPLWARQRVLSCSCRNSAGQEAPVSLACRPRSRQTHSGTRARTSGVDHGEDRRDDRLTGSISTAGELVVVGEMEELGVEDAWVTSAPDWEPAMPRSTIIDSDHAVTAP